MKTHLKVLLAMLLVLMCAFACVACGDNSSSDTENPAPGPQDPTKPSDTPVAVETYKINFVYSYTTRIINDYGRPTTVMEKKAVKTIEVPKSNAVLTDAQRTEIAEILYHSYGFEHWYTEADWVVDNDTNTQYPKEGSTPYSFPSTPITADMTLYGTKGTLAGRDARWEIKEITQTNEKTGKEEIIDIALIISGSGDMFGYDDTNAIDIPWYGYSVKEPQWNEKEQKEELVEIRSYKDITKIVLSPDITSVGKNAFYGLTGVKTIEFGENSKLVEVKDSSFMGLSAMKTLTTPASLKIIGKSAFDSTGLTSLRLNDGLETISESAFSGSKGISWIILPKTVKNIGASAFDPGPGNTATSHSLSKVFYTGDRPADGLALFDPDRATPIINVTFGNNDALTKKATVYYYKEYGDDAASVRDASWYYFSDEEGRAVDEPMPYCLTLKYYLPNTPLTPQWVDYVPATPKWEVNKNGIGSYKPAGVLDQANVDFRGDISYNGYKFASYGDDGKYTLNGAKSNFCEGAKILSDMDCTLARGKILSEGGGVVFAYSSGTLSVALDPIAINEGASTNIWNFADGADTGFLWTGKNTDLKNIKTLNIADGITYIGTLAFNGMINISYVVIPDTVKGISVSSFLACASLSSIYYNGDLEFCMLYDKAGQLINIKDADGNLVPVSLADISNRDVLAAGAFNAEGKEITLKSGDQENPATVKNLLDDARFNTITVYEYSENGTTDDGSYWTSIDGKYLAWTMTTSITGEDQSVSRSIYIAGDADMVDFASETATPWYSTEIVETLKSASFANNILTIGENILHRYYNLEEIALAGNVMDIPSTSFAGTALLQDTRKYESGMLIINNLLIKVDIGRQNVEYFEVPYNTTLIASGAFDGCDNIKEIYIPLTVSSIGENAFAGLTSLNVIYVDATSAAWENVSSKAGYDPHVFVCGYDDHDWDADGNKDEKLWRRANGNVGRIELVKGFCAGCFDAEGKTTHTHGTETCKHIWGEWTEATEKNLLPTHTKNGATVRICTVDGCNARDYDYDAVPMANTKVDGKYVHEFGTYIIDQTSHCTSNMTMSAKCKYCNETDVIEIPDTMIAGGHKFVYTQGAAATCYSVGTLIGTCTNEFCGETIEIDDPVQQPKLAHTYESATYYPYETSPCLEDHIYARACIAEGCTYLDKITQKNDNEVTEHIWIEVAANKYLFERATEVSSNKYYKSCENCGKSCKGITDEVFLDPNSRLVSYNWDDTTLKGTITSGGKFDLASNLDKFNYATIVREGALKVLEIGKNKGASNSILRITNANTVKVTDDEVYHYLDTRFRTGDVVFEECDYLYRLGFSNGESSFFNLYFVAESENEIKIYADSLEGDSIATITAGEWSNISVKYMSELQSMSENLTPEVKPDDEDYDPENPPATIIKTVYYYNVEIVINGTLVKYKQVVDSKDGISNTAFTYVESEINEKVVSARFYLDDTVIKSLSAASLKINENETPDPVDTPETPEPTPEIPQHKFEEDKTDSDGLLETPNDGINITIKDGKKDPDGYYEYIQSEIADGKLNVTTAANDKGAAFTSNTAFIYDSLTTKDANKLYVFDAKLQLLAGKHQIVFANSAMTLQSFALDIEIADTGLVISDTQKGADGEISKITVESITAETEFDIRIELYSITTTGGSKMVAKIFVNDKFVGTSDSATLVSNKIPGYAIDKVAVYHKVTENASITFDDVYVFATETNVVYIPEVVTK